MIKLSKPTFSSIPIRQIACASDDNWFSTALFEKRVTTWSLAEQRHYCDLETHFDFGGSRMCVLSGERPIVFIGSHCDKSVSAYSVTQGELLWTRQALGSVDWVHPLHFDGNVLVCVDENRIYQVDSLSGNTISQFHATKIFSNSYNAHLLKVSKPHFGLWSVSEGRFVWRHLLESFGVLSVAFSSEAVLVTEPCGPVRAFTIDGEPLWSNPCHAEKHIVNCAWNYEISSWVGVELAYNTKGLPRSIVVWDRDGNVTFSEFIGTPADTQVFPSGRYLVTSDGQVLKAPSLEVEWEFVQ